MRYQDTTFIRDGEKYIISEWWESNTNRLGAEGYHRIEVTEKEWFTRKAEARLAEARYELRMAEQYIKEVEKRYEEPKPQHVIDYVPQPVYGNEDKPTLRLNK